MQGFKSLLQSIKYLVRQSMGLFAPLPLLIRAVMNIRHAFPVEFSMLL